MPLLPPLIARIKSVLDKLIEYDKKPATSSAAGHVKPDNSTLTVSDDGTLSVNQDLLSTVYKFKGSVATESDLPEGAAPGDVYNCTDTGANYAWTGTEWDNIGGIEAVDAKPTDGSKNPVSSDGVFDALTERDVTEQAGFPVSVEWPVLE